MSQNKDNEVFSASYKGSAVVGFYKKPLKIPQEFSQRNPYKFSMLLLKGSACYSVIQFLCVSCISTLKYSVIAVKTKDTVRNSGLLKIPGYLSTLCFLEECSLDAIPIVKQSELDINP